MNYETSNIITYLQSVCKSEKERFFIGSINQGGKFFHSYCNKYQLSEIDPVFNLLCLNSFDIHEYSVKRTQDRLSTVYSLNIDLDGWNESTPLSHLDILEKWDELGFIKNPSVIIKTSEGRFHIILWLKPLAAFPEKISYWKKCQKGICEALKEFGADPQSPVNFIRIPGSVNYKYCYKPVVEVVFSSESIFTLSEIYQVLIDNDIYRRKPKRTNTSLFEGIKELEKGV